MVIVSNIKANFSVDFFENVCWFTPSWIYCFFLYYFVFNYCRYLIIIFFVFIRYRRPVHKFDSKIIATRIGNFRYLN